MAKKICIDAGHYGRYNRSPAVKTYFESEMTWKLHLLLKKHLERFGFTVITTRSNKDKDLSLYERGKASKGCDLFLSLHSNATGSGVNESVDRVDVYAPLSGKGHDIARKLANCIVEVMGTKQGGNVKTRKGNNGEYYGVLRGAAAVGTVGLLVEHSFHTCTRSAKWLLDGNNLDKLAKAEAEVLAAYFGVSAATDTGAQNFTRIAGEAQATAQQMQEYIKGKNPTVAQSVLDMIPLYLSEGAAEGIRGDIAFAQSCLETGNFAFKGSAVTLSQNNFCGMGVTATGERGNSFDTPQLGIRAQIQHLKAYANAEALVNDCIDPRFKYVARGSAEFVEWLGIKENPNGKGWASGVNYGGKILGILDVILSTEDGNEPGDVLEAEALTVDGKWGSDTTRRLQKIFGTPADGSISNPHIRYKADNPGLMSGWCWREKPNGKGSALIKALQKWAGMPTGERDGMIGPVTIKALQRKLGTVEDGKVSKPSAMVKALQKWANKQ